MTVAVACPMDINSLKLQAKFNRVGSDTCSVRGTLPALPPDFSLTNATATLDVGDAQVDFQLNAKGRGVNPYGTIRFSYNKKTGIWTVTGKLKGYLKGAWAGHGLTNQILINAQVTVPVVLLLRLDALESFAVEPVLSYTDKAGVSGTATYVPR